MHAELKRLARSCFRPGLAFGIGLVADAERPGRPLLLLETLELAHRREQRPAAAILEPQDALASRHGRLEAEPGLDDAVGDA